jgi:hypothetical protein
MARKIFGREAASAARNFRGEEQLCIAISFRRDLTKNEKASAMRTPFVKYLFRLLMLFIATVLGVHVVFHVFDHGVELGLLFVSQDFAHF